MNVAEFLKEAFEALSTGDETHKHEFIEKWVPEVSNEIENLRNKVVLLETRIIDLEQDLDFYKEP